MQTINVTPADLAGSGSNRALSPEAQGIVDRLKEYYRDQGKAGAAQNYARYLKAFFAWAEGQGYSVHDLPASSVEDFLATRTSAGQKDTTVHLIRGQLKTSLREAHSSLGIDFAHLEYETGKPPSVRAHQKAKERVKKAEARQVADDTRSNAISAASAAYAAMTPHTPEEYAPHTPEEYAPADPYATEDAYPMSNPSLPPLNGAAPASPPHTPQSNTPTVVVMNAPAQTSPGRASITQRGGTAPATATPARGILINNLVFTGPYVRISRIADGSDPLSPPGTENIVQTVSAAHVLSHGDIASYLQQWTLPSIALKPGVTTISLVFTELNEKKQPTGRRDELSFNVPPGGFNGSVVNVAPVGAAAAPAPTSPAFDKATEYLLKKLDSDADAARRKADDLQEQLRKTTDAQTTFMLNQQMQAAQDLKRELEERKEREMIRALAPAPQPVALPPVPSAGLAGLGFLDAPPSRPDTSAEMAKAFADGQARSSEAQSRMMEALLVRLATPPPPPPPVKDSTEFMLTFFANMNQQAQAQAASQQQMMMQMMQSQQQQSQQFMQVLMAPRENTVEKMLMLQLEEVKRVAAAPKADEVEDFADKLQKMQAVTQMLGGGSSSNFLADLLQNADSIGAGAAQIIAAAKGAKTEAPVTKAVRAEQQQLAAPPSAGALPAPSAPIEPPKPTQGMLDAHTAFVAALETRNEQAIADGFVKLMVELSTAQEPYVSMARRILGIFAEAEEEADLYEAAKALWTAVGKPVFRPSAKLAAKVFAKWYSPLHKAFFDVEKTLPSLAEAEDGAQGSEAAQTVEQGDEGEGEEDGDDEGEEDGDEEVV